MTCYPKAFGGGGSGGSSGSLRAAHVVVRPADTGTELSDLVGDVNTESDRMQAELGPLVVIFGDQKWFACSTADAPKFADFYTAFLSTITTDGPSTPITPAQQSSLDQMPLPAQLAPSDVDTLVQRWNNTISYYNQGILNSTQVPAGKSTNFIAQDTMAAASTQAQEASTDDAGDGYTLFGQGLETAEQNVENYILNPDNEQAGVCATVKIQLSQTVEITRTAFGATLDLTNSGENVPLSAIGVNLKVTDSQGNDVTSLFSISTPATSVFGGGGVDGTGTLPDRSRPVDNLAERAGRRERDCHLLCQRHGHLHAERHGDHHSALSHRHYGRSGSVPEAALLPADHGLRPGPDRSAERNHRSDRTVLAWNPGG
jgi:hypothetical protein